VSTPTRKIQKRLFAAFVCVSLRQKKLDGNSLDSEPSCRYLMKGTKSLRSPTMDFYPENILLEIISLLNAPSPPGGSLTGWEEAEISLQDITFIWWLEYFLRTEPAAFEEKFDSLPRLEQSFLVAQIWRCFLHQPLMRRLFPSKTRPAKIHPWKVVRDGSLLQLTSEGENIVTTGLFYIYPHCRLWPGLSNNLQGKVFLTPGDLKSIQTAIEFTLQSRLIDIRGRAEGLHSFLIHPDPNLPWDGESPPADQEPAIKVFKPKMARKKKKSGGQLNLFE
jgi:hypothetical protein